MCVKICDRCAKLHCRGQNDTQEFWAFWSAEGTFLVCANMADVQNARGQNDTKEFIACAGGGHLSSVLLYLFCLRDKRLGRA